MNQSRIGLANLPTPLEPAPRLTEMWGGPTIWIKRDDLTGFGLSGNKVRKLEFHLAAAIDAGADTVITCGAVQSNHCRATALAAARVGLDAILYLRSPDGSPPPGITGNHFLQRLAGAECRFVTPAEYDERDRIMAAAAGEHDGTAWVIPEGASDATGALGFVAAMREFAARARDLEIVRPAIWHAASSGGTTAGMILGAAATGVDVEIIGSSVGDPASQLDRRVREIVEESMDRFGSRAGAVEWSITDAHVGGGYGSTTPAELAEQAAVTRRTGLIFDPTYTGKAIYGLHREIEAGRFGPGDDVVFWHTGGGFAAFAFPQLAE